MKKVWMGVVTGSLRHKEVDSWKVKSPALTRRRAYLLVFNPHLKSSLAICISDESSLVMASSDLCSPRPICVPIPADPDPSVVYFPPCTRLQRCDGCCGDALVICVPSPAAVRQVPVKVTS